MEKMDYQVEHFLEQSRFEIIEEGRRAYLEYKIQDNRMDILHTVVPQELGGRGIGSALMREAFRYASEKRLEVFPVCGFAASYLSRFPPGNGG